MATRTIANGGGNFSAIGSWVEGIVPIAGDAVVATATSGNLTVDVPSACASMVLTGYVGTLTFNSTLTLTSTCTFVAGMSVAGTAGTLIIGVNATITSAGKTLPCALTLSSNNNTTTLADNWIVNGLVTVGNVAAGATTTINGNTLTCNAGLHNVAGAGGGFVTGSTRLVLTGGTWDTTGQALNNPVDLAGNVTISGTIPYNSSGASKTIRYVSGTITTTGSTLSITGSNTTLDTAGMTWNNVTFGTGATTNALSSNLAWSGTLALTNSAAITFTGAGTLSGTGAVTTSSTFTVTFNNTEGLLTSGLLTTGASMTFAGTGSITVGSLTLSNAITITINNTGGITCTGTMTLSNAAVTFAGSAGFTVGTLTTAALSASRIYTLTLGNTYVVNTLLASLATSAFRMALKSSSAGNKVTFNLTAGATQQLVFCDPTDVDSSGGQQIVSIGGTITNTLNWVNAVPAAGGGSGGGGRVYHMGL